VEQWQIEPLRDQHCLTDFDCGKPPLSVWLRHSARQFQERDLARVYVAVRPDQNLVCGYYSLSVSSVSFAEAPPSGPWKKLPQRMPIPVALIGKLAVDRKAQGNRLGGLMLVDALRRIAAMADRIGIQSIVVDAIDEEAKSFYLKYGFVAAVDQPLRLFYPMQAARKLLPPVI
jgi:predicted GNAT family N-acyltransferase